VSARAGAAATVVSRAGATTSALRVASESAVTVGDAGAEGVAAVEAAQGVVGGFVVAAGALHRGGRGLGILSRKAEPALL